MPPRSVVALSVAMLLWPGSGHAATECDGTTQAELNECASDDYARSDAAMNTAYAKIMRRIGPRAQQALREAQRAWLTQRDRTCDLEAMKVEGGSAESMVRAGCLSRVTESRTRTLKSYSACDEDDASCVGGIAE